MAGFNRFDGKVALVTGGGSGIGRAAALAFARAGAKVVVAGRRMVEGNETVEQIQIEGGTALFVRTDVSNSADIKALVDKTVAAYGHLDYVFNNAGTEGVFAPITELTEENWDSTIAVNLKAVWLLLKSEIEQMVEQGTGGAIVNTSSWLAQGGFAGSTIYSASKAGLDGMLRPAALEAAQAGIRINNINPGIIDTPMLRRFGNDDTFFQPFVAHTPLQRLGTPSEVAEVVVWLCSDAASFVTGQTLLVDGGFTIPGFRW